MLASAQKQLPNRPKRAQAPMASAAVGEPLYQIIRGGNNTKPFRRAMQLRSRWARQHGAGPPWVAFAVQGEASAIALPPSMLEECWCTQFVWKATGRKSKGCPATFKLWHKTPLLRQVFNHIGAIEPLTAKDRLFRVMKAYASAKGCAMGELGVPDTFLVQPRSGQAPELWRGWNEFVISHADHAALPGCRNLWLLKPSNANRGNGIEVVDSLDAARATLERVATKASMGVQATWVVQKYIENPLLLAGRKFDLRVWVLVTDDGDVYVHGPGYVRTSSEPFAMDTLDRRVHLTNYCLQVKHQGAGSSFGRFETGNTISWEQLAAYLGQVAQGQRSHSVEAVPPLDPAADPTGAVMPLLGAIGPPVVQHRRPPPASASLDGSADMVSVRAQWPPVADTAAWAAGCTAFWGPGGVWEQSVNLVRETIRALRVPRQTAGSANGCREYGFGDKPAPSGRHRFELLGYDFMVTTNVPDGSETGDLGESSCGIAATALTPQEAAARLGLGVSLIEVNSNPSISYQSHWHKALVDLMVHRALRLTVDSVFGSAEPRKGMDPGTAGVLSPVQRQRSVRDTVDSPAAPSKRATKAEDGTAGSAAKTDSDSATSDDAALLDELLSSEDEDDGGDARESEADDDDVDTSDHRAAALASAPPRPMALPKLRSSVTSPRSPKAGTPTAACRAASSASSWFLPSRTAVRAVSSSSCSAGATGVKAAELDSVRCLHFASDGSGVPLLRHLPTEPEERRASLSRGWVHVLNAHRCRAVVSDASSLRAQATLNARAKAAAERRRTASGEAMSDLRTMATVTRARAASSSSASGVTAVVGTVPRRTTATATTFAPAPETIRRPTHFRAGVVSGGHRVEASPAKRGTTTTQGQSDSPSLLPSAAPHTAATGSTHVASSAKSRSVPRARAERQVPTGRSSSGLPPQQRRNGSARSALTGAAAAWMQGLDRGTPGSLADTRMFARAEATVLRSVDGAGKVGQGASVAASGTAVSGRGTGSAQTDTAGDPTAQRLSSDGRAAAMSRLRGKGICLGDPRVSTEPASKAEPAAIRPRVLASAFVSGAHLPLMHLPVAKPHLTPREYAVDTGFGGGRASTGSRAGGVALSRQAIARMARRPAADDAAK